MKISLDTFALIAGIAIMAWGQWGIPAEPIATFALGAGLSVVPVIRIARKALEDAS